jgi:hypothetical protein
LHPFFPPFPRRTLLSALVASFALDASPLPPVALPSFALPSLAVRSARCEWFADRQLAASLNLAAGQSNDVSAAFFLRVCRMKIASAIITKDFHHG